jgi:mannosyltransferase
LSTAARWLHGGWRTALLVGLVGCLVLIPGIGTPSLWYDEAVTWQATTMSFTRLLRSLSEEDAVLGAYYVIENAWVRVAGDSAAALRLPSAMAMAGAAALTSLLADRWRGPGLGLTAGLLFVAIPSVTRYGQEARPYALVVFAAVLSTLLLLVAIDRRTRAWRVAYAASVAVLGILHVTAMLVLAAHALVAVRRHAIRPIVPYLAVALVPVAAMAIIGWSQRMQIEWIEPATPERLFGQLGILVGGIVALACIVGVLLASARLREAREPLEAAALPYMLLFMVGLITPMFVARYALYVLPFIAVGVAAAVGPRNHVRGLLLAGAFVILTMPDQLAYRQPGGHGIDASGAVAWMVARCEAGDAYDALGPTGAPVRYYVADAPGCRPDRVPLQAANDVRRLFVARPGGSLTTLPAPEGFTFVEGVALTGVNVSLYEAR